MKYINAIKSLAKFFCQLVEQCQRNQQSAGLTFA